MLLIEFAAIGETMIKLVIYIGILLAMLILAVISRKEPLLSEEPVNGIEAVLRKMAVYLYKKVRRAGKRSRGKNRFLFSDAVRNDLVILNPSLRPERAEALHQIEKIQLLLAFFLAADILASALWISEWNQGSIQQDGTIKRPAYTEASVTVTADAVSKSANGEEISYGEYQIQVNQRRYTAAQAQKLAEELFSLLPEQLKGENRSLEYVTENLNFVSEVENYPFRIQWESSSYDLVDTDGTVHAERVEAGKAEQVTVTATLIYEENRWSNDYEMLLFPRSTSQEEKTQKLVQEELDKENAASLENEYYRLPASIAGVPVQWLEKKEETSLLIFLLIITAGILASYSKDQEIHRSLRKRERELALDYPLVISKMTLFLGAGMSIRNIFYRLGEEYKDKRRKGGAKRYVYEEILLVCRELDSGISETAACADFGKRCRSRQYSKLSALLTANLTKGNGALLKALQEEAEHSFEERRGIARQMGEEAGTRLLLPMLMMLGITLVIIMIPAYFSFSL